MMIMQTDVIINFVGADEEKEEQEIQIGMPTDVKHVAHIGADRPAAESPSWVTLDLFLDKTVFFHFMIECNLYI